MARTKNGSMKPRWGVGLIALAVVGILGSDGVRTGIVNATYAAAQAEAASDGTKIPSTNDFTVDSAGTVSLVLAKTNQTLVLGRFNQSWKSFSATASSTWAP